MQDRGAVSALMVRIAADRRDAFTGAITQSVKRAGDVAVAAIILLALLPLLLCVALLIRNSGPGGIFYGHARVGRNGRSFRCLKFRTMYADADQRLAALLASDPASAAEWSRTRKLERDPRVSGIGGLLRKTSLDELPQLLNVLRGEMSLVGPRPITRDELCRYGTSARYYFSVTPGVTGLWQVSGRNNLSYAERVRLDASYARNWSLGSDLRILLRTPAAVLLRQGAR
jgi:Undecaprenyl-phosphate galactose phosphotransferase WbaP